MAGGKVGGVLRHVPPVTQGNVNVPTATLPYPAPRLFTCGRDHRGTGRTTKTDPPSSSSVVGQLPPVRSQLMSVRVELPSAGGTRVLGQVRFVSLLRDVLVLSQLAITSNS